MAFNGKEIGELIEIIKASFSINTFGLFLTTRLNNDINNYTGLDSFPIMIYRVIEGSNMEGWNLELLEALKNERPRNKELQTFSLRVGELKDIAYKENPDKSESLEKIINEDPLLEPEIFLTGLYQTKKCICRIEVYDQKNRVSHGTGFLIAEDIVMTNYHVVKDIIDNKELSSKVNCKFDYHYNVDGILNKGTDIGLDDKQPILFYRKYSKLDEQPPDNIEAEWPVDQLDYALIRLNQKIGLEPFGMNASIVSASDENIRSWIKKVNLNTQALQQGEDMIILQHPKSQPLKIAIGLSKIMGSDSRFRRVRYAINTEPGSSGAAGFDVNFNWIALHNLGDPEWVARYNQGVTAKSIIEDLISNNFKDFDICK